MLHEQCGIAEFLCLLCELCCIVIELCFLKNLIYLFCNNKTQIYLSASAQIAFLCTTNKNCCLKVHLCVLSDENVIVGAVMTSICFLFLRCIFITCICSTCIVHLCVLLHKYDSCIFPTRMYLMYI